MKGYFSQIAKQTGLRYSRDSVKQRRSTKLEAASKDPAPIDVDETVMVSPLKAERSAMPRREENTLRTTQPPEIKAGSVRTPETANPQVDKETSKEVQNAPIKKRELASRETAEPQSLKMQDHAVETAKASTKAAETFAEPVIEQTLVKEAGRSDDRSESPRSEPRLAKTEPAKDLTDDNSAPETEKKIYFAKTAEIIERGDAEPAEIEQILLSEVQQWAADSPEETAIADIVVEQTEPRITKQIVRPSLEQTEFVTEQTSSQRDETDRVTEQTFELSIGSINVVVEDEKPAQTAPPPRREGQTVAAGSERQFSRLSRHYL